MARGASLRFKSRGAAGGIGSNLVGLNGIVDEILPGLGSKLSQQLLPKGEGLQEECFSGAKDGDDPAEQILKARKHQGIIAKSKPGRCASKSLILRTYGIVASHKFLRRQSDAQPPPG